MGAGSGRILVVHLLPNTMRTLLPALTIGFNNAVLAEARRYPGQEKMVFEFYQKNPNALDSLRAPLFEEKVVDFMLGKVKRNETVVTVKELYEYDPDAPKAKKKKK